ncbi:MAG: ABC transporter permease [Acidimicrobiales bacterium]
MADLDVVALADPLGSGLDPMAPGADSAIPPTRHPALLGLAGVLVGVVGLVVSTMVLTDADAVVRLGVAAVGMFALYVGLRVLGVAVFGPRFDLGLWLSVGWLSIVVLAATFADLLPLAESKNVSRTLATPILLRPDLFSEHPFGTDRQGLDILGGVIYGARVSLIVGIGAVLIGMTIGGTIGLAAGYFRGKWDTVVGVVSDSMLAVPPLILLLGMVAVLEPSVRNVTIALAILGVPTYIRLARANTLMYAQREFVLAARALGDRNRSIMFRELLPNVLLAVLPFAFLGVAVLIVAEASLSFLGLSVQRPNPTWGNMIAAGQEQFDEHPHLVFVPGTVLFLSVFAFNRVGDRARELWDPRQAKL